MRGYVDDTGDPLAINPTVIVVPGSLQGTAEALFKKQVLAGGETNELYGAVEIVVSPYLV